VISSDGYLLTAAHNMEQHAPAVLVRTAASTFEWRKTRVVWSGAPSIDLAVLKTGPSLAHFGWAREPECATGAEVVGAGFAAIGPSVTLVDWKDLSTPYGGGVIEVVRLPATGKEFPGTTEYRVRAPIFRGDSGGPVVTRDGRLVGVLVSVQVRLGDDRLTRPARLYGSVLRPDLAWLDALIERDRSTNSSVSR
jgi:S1-C subfamily serine protease